MFFIYFYLHSLNSSHHVSCHFSFLSPGREGKGVATINAGTGCAIFGVPFFEQKINFGVSFLVKSQVVISFRVSF